MRMSSIFFNMLHSLKPFQCPSCASTYSGKDISRFHSVTRFPRILTCGHSVCENCLQAAEKSHKTFTCPECKKNVELSTENINENFLPDVHALGIISANLKNSLPSLKVKMVPTSDLKRNHSQDSMKTEGSNIICGNCTHQAFWRCDECQLNFCSLCFKKFHEGKSKKKHEGKRIFAELYNSLVQEGCQKHENKTVEFYCEVDGELTCSHCMLVGDHVGHQVKTLVDKNKSCAEDLKNALGDISNLQKQLKYTDHVLSEKIPKERLDISDTIKNLHDYFHTLHAILQLREAELISELTTISQRNVKPLEDMRMKVTNYERELASITKDAESVIENPRLAVSAAAILKKIEETKNIPCYLVPLPDEAERNFTLNIILPEDLEKQIKDFGEIHFDGKARFALLPGDDLPEDFCKDIPESFSSKISVVDAESGSECISVFSEDSLSVKSTNSSLSNMRASMKCRDFNKNIKMQPEKVIVSHVTSPSSFYVQKYNNLLKLKNMSEQINKWCKSYESRNSKVDRIERGDLYLVRYSVDNRWYRGRIKNVLKSNKFKANDENSLITDENEKFIVNDKDMLVEVFFIDYGNTETTSLANMKMIQARFLNMPGVAKHCCLADIEPSQGEQWSPDCIKSFKTIVFNKPSIMKVLDEVNNILLVDLNQSSDDIASDVLVSVRDALVFLEFGVFKSDLKITQKRYKNEKCCMPPESLCINSKVCVIVSHVDNPSNFYVQQMSTASYLSGLINEMCETYNEEENPMLHNIYAPRIGMMCAAQYSVDKQWYRAKVIDLPGGAVVKVQYVDFGNTEVVHHRYLRKLLDRFYKLNIQAIPCKLAQVTYNQEKGWRLEVKKWLTEHCSRRKLMLKSLGTVPGENKAEVVLTFVENDEEICINALLVEEGFGESTGEYSKATRKKIEGRAPQKELKLTDSILSLRDMATSAIPPPVPKDAQNESLIPSQTNSSSNNTTSSPQRKYPTLAPPTVQDGTNHIEVHVSHIETPGSFYIQVASDKEKLNRLMSNMQEAFESLEGEAFECTEGKAYAVFCKTQKKWLRGTVESKISEEKVKVYYVDFGNTEEVDKKNLRKLTGNFHVDEAYSIRCRLDEIVPAGGSTQWPAIACERFHQLVTPHEVLLLSSKGEYDTETRSLPADLLVENLIRGGALEPTKIEYVSITTQLILQGMGLPVRRKGTNSGESKPLETPETKQINNAKFEAAQKFNKMSNPIDFYQNQHSVITPTEDDLPPAKPAFQWKPCEPPSESVFKGQVSNIGEDGSIHLYALKKDSTSKVDTIVQSLQFIYRSKPYDRLKIAPAIGEACIAKFSVDNQWYRAEVISAYPGKVKVNFVDYGNNEIVPLSDIRLDLRLKDWPKECLECALFDIEDNVAEKWDTELLTFLHGQLVETIVTVEIKAPPDKKGRLQCSITTSSGINISELLKSMGFGDSTAMSATNKLPNSQVVKTFPRASELRAGDILPVCVTQPDLEKNIVYLQIREISQPKDEYEEKLNKTHVAFLQLISNLRENADTFPKVVKPMPGMACCAKYSYDNDWYRCEITDLTEDGVIVLYVDYGNSEAISCDNLRELQNNYIDFPVQVHFCKLHGLTPVSDTWNPEVLDILVTTLVTSKDLFAKVVIPGTISQVDLLIKTEDESFKLAYEDLIAKELVVLQKNHL